jgi:anti-sigma B factor antagonist
METNSTNSEATKILRLTGRIDSTVAAELEQTIKTATDAQPAGLVLDFAAVDFLSSAGLRVMLSAAKRCRQQGTGLALHSLRPQIADVFAMGGLTAFLPAYPDEATALRAVQR